MTLDEKIIELKEEIIEGVQKCVGIKSVEEEPKDNMPFGGGVQKALEYSLKLSKDLGFKTVNLDNMIAYAEYGEGEEMIAVLGHLDVVPEGNGWTYPPYDGEIHDGKIYGRGTTDDKGPIIGALYALKAIKDLNLSLEKRVRIIFGLNEETGSRCVKHYIEKGEEMPSAGFTPDAEYPIINGEKGIVTSSYMRNFIQQGECILKSIKGGIAPNVVPEYAEAEIQIPKSMIDIVKKLAGDVEEIRVEEKEELLLIKSFGISAHGSRPEEGKNAISYLLLFLGKLDFIGDVKEFIDFMNKNIGLDTEGRNLGIYLQDE
ncbi:MAG: Sapep family Mn(2+)-dependent dipeptidase, partial [Clostridiaceae bacterium]|nr:Sapep family Mn(2+)-dependent dipeptidase [Clostridiaceae bacterium]